MCLIAIVFVVVLRWHSSNDGGGGVLFECLFAWVCLRVSVWTTGSSILAFCSKDEEEEALHVARL